eukprot:CAMPEP_0185755052 /NCGR_PEP_ID=MMETSP1174-20130828/13599_1 /TAXON_ID=35687 /ORGANISM="Dictyocha speculum, Strain CCMP1381" /LENGTH=357 /DNA_ID=CAMNT_0028433475 /DNA_START=63 /DNA_END=1137 /DNA_ORIENTATION=+
MSRLSTRRQAGMDNSYTLGQPAGQMGQRHHVRLTSDVVDYEPHPSPDDFNMRHVLEVFPLLGKKSEGYLCTQGCGGGLTHFSHPSTFHALDFRCPVGTPVVAVGAGRVVEVRQACCVSGILVANLFQWNALTIELDNDGSDDDESDDETTTRNSSPGSAAPAPAPPPSPRSVPVREEPVLSSSSADASSKAFSFSFSIPETESAAPRADTAAAASASTRLRGRGRGRLLIEYVHIKPHSTTLKVGDRVQAGQVICLTGDVGFCPEPHLHIEAHAEDTPQAPSVRVAWRDNRDGSVYFPEAGSWYGPNGPIASSPSPLSTPLPLCTPCMKKEGGNDILELVIPPDEAPCQTRYAGICY